MSQRIVCLGLAVCLALGIGGYSVARTRKRPTGVRESKFFKVNLDTHKVVGHSDRVSAALRLDLTSVTTDQPQYWPNEKVYLRILALGRPGIEWSGKLTKRDSQARELTGTLDGQGVAVVEVADGSQAPLELGEYRIDVSVSGGKAKGTATFAVVQGTLGALSFAHEFRKVTKAEELDTMAGGWFLGNAAGAGARWGNGLSFKNELRASNHPFNGEVEVHSRCMLPGCNGVHAGPSQRLKVEAGRLSGTLNISSHSGPFQIEVVSPRGSLRHQFEGSSHVERDMVAISGGVSYLHRVGLAPYESTVQVPGRDLFVESKKGSDDPFTVETVMVKPGTSKLTVQANQAVRAPALVAHQPKSDGTFESRPISLPAELAAGKKLEVEVQSPYTLITVGGFVGAQQDFKEGWALGLLPSGLKVDVESPAEGRPRSSVPVTVSARDLSGKGVALSAILEVYDNRVPARSPQTPLGSAIGDSVRNASRSVSSWVDTTGIVEQDEEEEKAPPRPSPMKKNQDIVTTPRAAMKSKDSSASAYGLGLSGMGRGGGGMGYGSIGIATGAAAAPAMRMRASVGVGGSGGGGRKSVAVDEEVHDEIREGDRKVVFCGLIKTDEKGQARVEIPLPPQSGRMIVRLSAVHGLDYAGTQRQLDVKRVAGAEARLPRSFVPGAKLVVPVDTNNQTTETLTLTADGIGLNAPVVKNVTPGHGVFDLPLHLYKPGVLSLSLRDAGGKLYDQRELPLETLGDQPVTYSRLVFGDGGKVAVGAGETARVYAGAGRLLRGVVMNVVTTSESWFGHAEALSARVAVRSVLLAAISKKLLDDEGLGHTIRTGIDKDVRDLNEAFFDQEAGLIRPYPRVAASPLWSAWVARNLLSATKALEQANSTDVRVKQANETAKTLTDRLRKGLLARGIVTEEQAGFDSQGQWVIPVEVDGKVVYRVLTDDAVTKWASDKLLSRLDLDADTQDADVALRKLYDVYRFLRAFERVGNLQYLTDLATAYYLKGDHATFAKLYRKVARGMILTQEPGLLQGPALLGGVYSTPMALVRFLELQLLLGGHNKPTDAGQKDGAPLRFEQAVTGPSTLTVPAGAIVRLDKKGSVRMAPTSNAFARVSVSKPSVQVGEELSLEVQLDPSRDPLEYYAVIAVPTTTSIKQTEDILSDYRGQLIYGQQGQGGTQMQILTVPFRGSRNVRLLLEGAYRGSSTGLVMIRHIESKDLASGVAVSEVSVR